MPGAGTGDPRAGDAVPSRRLLGVDATRGLALLGMMAVHVLPGLDPDGSVSTPHLIAGGRSAATFAVLAGVGLALATGGVRPLSGPSSGRARAAAAAGIAARAAVIGVIGLLIGPFDSGVAVILAYYALLFLFAIPLLGLRPRALVVLATAAALLVPPLSHLLRPSLPAPERANPSLPAVLADLPSWVATLLVTGYYPVLAWTAYLCAGLAVGRLRLRSTRVAAGLLTVGGGLAAGAVGLSALLLGPLGGRAALEVASPSVHGLALDVALSSTQYGTTPTTSWWWLAVDAPHASTPLDLVHTIGVALALLGAMLLLGRLVAARVVPIGGVLIGAALQVLAAVGSMTLTLYTAHVLLLASGVLPEDSGTSYRLQVLAVLVLAPLWRRGGRRGPLEALAAALAERARRSVAAAPEGPSQAVVPG